MNTPSSLSLSSAFTFLHVPYSFRLSISVSKLRQKQRRPLRHLSSSLQFAHSEHKKAEHGVYSSLPSLSLLPPTSSLCLYFPFWSWTGTFFAFIPSFFLSFLPPLSLSSPCLFPSMTDSPEGWDAALLPHVHPLYRNLIQTDFHCHRGLPDNPDRLQEESFRNISASQLNLSSCS